MATYSRTELKLLLCFCAVMLFVCKVDAKEFTGKVMYSDKCSHLFERLKVSNAYYAAEGHVCCLCGRGKYWNADCRNNIKYYVIRNGTILLACFYVRWCEHNSEGLPETTQCIGCTYTETYRSFIDYEPHKRTSCFVDDDCTPPRFPVGGSPARRARCECPAGMKPDGEDLCVLDNNPNIASDHTSTTTRSPTTTTATEMFTSAEYGSDHYSDNIAKKEAPSGEPSQVNLLVVFFMIIIALVLLVAVAYGAYRLLNKRPTNHSSGKESIQNSVSSSVSNVSQGPDLSSTALITQPPSSHLTHINEQREVCNKAIPIRRTERSNRVEGEYGIPTEGPQSQPLLPGEDKVQKAILGMSGVIEEKDLNRIGHLLGIPSLELNNLQREHRYDTRERSTQVFFKYRQLHPETTLMDLKNRVADFPYLKKVVEDIMRDT